MCSSDLQEKTKKRQTQKQEKNQVVEGAGLTFFFDRGVRRLEAQVLGQGQQPAHFLVDRKVDIRFVVALFDGIDGKDRGPLRGLKKLLHQPPGPHGVLNLNFQNISKLEFGGHLAVYEVDQGQALDEDAREGLSRLLRGGILFWEVSY